MAGILQFSCIQCFKNITWGFGHYPTRSNFACWWFSALGWIDSRDTAPGLVVELFDLQFISRISISLIMWLNRARFNIIWLVCYYALNILCFMSLKRHCLSFIRKNVTVILLVSCIWILQSISNHCNEALRLLRSIWYFRLVASVRQSIWLRVKVIISTICNLIF